MIFLTPVHQHKVPWSAIALHINDLDQDCSNSIAEALELLQSCTNPSIQFIHKMVKQQFARNIFINRLLVWSWKQLNLYWPPFKVISVLVYWYRGPGPCITNVFGTCRKNFSQWHRRFQRKLRSHWLKFLRHVAITLVIQGPGSNQHPQNLYLSHTQDWADSRFAPSQRETTL